MDNFNGVKPTEGFEASGMFDDLLDDVGTNLQVDPDIAEELGQKIESETAFASESGYADHDDIMSGYEGSKSEDDEDALSAFLRDKGINPESIKIENEDGTVDEVSFDDLSAEEQYDLLHYNSNESDDLNDEEVNAVNFLRDNDMTLEELVQTVREKTLNELNKESEAVYTTDDFNDDELFIVDYRNKYGDEFSDDELLAELEAAKTNPEIFQRKIDKVRQEYKEYEDKETVRAQEAEKAVEEEARNKYVSTMVDIARGFSDLHDTVELDDDDRNKTLSFIFDQDNSGKTQFAKALDNPETVYKAAWYIQNGDNVFKEIHKYYQDEISKINRQSRSSNKVQAVVKEKPAKQHTGVNRPRSIDDLWG